MVLIYLTLNSWQLSSVTESLWFRILIILS